MPLPVPVRPCHTQAVFAWLRFCRMKASQLMKRPELHAAVTWWAHALMGDYVDDAGDFLINATAAVFKEKRHPWDRPTRESVERFKIALLCLMAAQFAEAWNDEQPNWASGNRNLAVDYEPNLILSTALAFARVAGTLRLPIKTVMWVSPGSVKVRCGYHGEEKQVFPAV